MTDNASPPPDDSLLVDSLNHPMAQQVRALLDSEQRDALPTILIDDEENIAQAVASGVVLRAVFCTVNRTLSDALLNALPSDVPIYDLSVRTGKKLFQNEKLSRTFAIAERPAPLGLDALADGTGDLVALEEITIAGNSGAIIRSTLALGAGGLVLLNVPPSALYDRRLIRASRGYLFTLPVVAASTDDFLAYCEAQRLEVVVTDAAAEETLDDIAALPQRLAFVFGSEKEGATETVTRAATRRVHIPIAATVESLNVSVAAAITLYARRVSRSRPAG